MFVGVDGCRGGWIAARSASVGAPVVVTMYPTFRDALADCSKASVIAVDIPIGLAERGDRLCDRQAREFLAPHRHSSIFSAPLRCVLGARTHVEASQRRYQVEGKRMSIQAFNILQKVTEVDTVLQASPSLAARVFEVHPELSFAAMNDGQPLVHSKKLPIGRTDRLALLHAHFGDAPLLAIDQRSKQNVAIDDVLDAFAVLWTAMRIGAGVANSLPASAPVDATGMRMAILR